MSKHGKGQAHMRWIIPAGITGVMASLTVYSLLAGDWWGTIYLLCTVFWAWITATEIGKL